MTTRIAYLIRDDRGARLDAVRLVTTHTDDLWEGDRFDSHEAVPAAEDAAEWMLNRCTTESTKNIDTICIDPDGSACSWLSVTSTESSALQAQVQSQGPTDPDDDFGSELESSSGRFPDLPGELTIEALPASLETPSKSAAAVATRIPVLAVPDATVRLLLDALDRRGVRVGSVCSLWHAAARAWDPSSPWADRGIRARGERVVASDAPVTAIVLIDPLGQRLVWSWASGGNLVAAGSMRVRTAIDRDVQRLGLDTVGELDRRVVLTDAEIGRLTQDWLSWAAQIGIAPSRVVCVGSPAEIGDDGMSPQRVGELIAARWPETTVDLIDEPDAVGATLKRLAAPQDNTDSPSGSPHSELVSLTRRPGSMHRSMYRWAGLSLAVAGVGLGVISVSLFGRASKYKAQEPRATSQIDEIVRRVDPTLVGKAYQTRLLENLVNEERKKLAPSPLGSPARPVLETFDTLSLILGAHGFKLMSLDVNSILVTIKVNAPDLQTAESLASALQTIEGLPVNWSTPDFKEILGGKTIQATYSGQWAKPARENTP